MCNYLHGFLLSAGGVQRHPQPVVHPCVVRVGVHFRGHLSEQEREQKREMETCVGTNVNTLDVGLGKYLEAHCFELLR